VTRGVGPVARSLLVALAAVRPLAGQTSYGQIHFDPRPRSTAVAATLRVPHGSAEDEPGLEGTTSLLTRVLEAQVARSLGRTGTGSVAARADRNSITFTLLTTPDAWRRDLARTDSVLFDGALDAELFERIRARALESLAFEEGSPVREYFEEVARILAPSGSLWPRAPGGTTASIGALTPAALERYRGAKLRRGSAVLVVVGVEAPPASSPSDTLPSEGEAPLTAPPDTGRAWNAGERTDVVRDVTSAWITIAYPAPRSAKRIELELLSFVLREELDPTPPDPDRYSVEVRLEDTPNGPVVVAEAAVLPEAADRWEARIRSAVTRLAETPIPPDFFRLRLRRFRANRLLAESAPEILAARIAGDLERKGAPRDLSAEIRRLDAAALSSIARSLGAPRVFRFGPDLGVDSGVRTPFGHLRLRDL
jgi:predicted Zn-dependent peptidase